MSNVYAKNREKIQAILEEVGNLSVAERVTVHDRLFKAMSSGSLDGFGVQDLKILFYANWVAAERLAGISTALAMVTMVKGVLEQINVVDTQGPDEGMAQA